MSPSDMKHHRKLQFLACKDEPAAYKCQEVNKEHLRQFSTKQDAFQFYPAFSLNRQKWRFNVPAALPRASLVQTIGHSMD